MTDAAPAQARPARVIAVLAVAIALNFAPIDFAAGAPFLLGWVVVAPLILALPAPWAITAAAVASAPFLLGRGAPCVSALMTLQAMALAFSRRRAPNVGLADVLFWAVVGVPAAMAYYTRLEAMPLEMAGIYAAVHALNGVAAVLVAEILIRTPLAEWLGLGAQAVIGVRALIFNAVFALACLPLLFAGFGISLLLRQSAAAQERILLEQAATQLREYLELHLRMHRASLMTAGRLIDANRVWAQAALNETRRTHPAFITLLVTDAEGRVRETSPADPRLRDANVSDRAYFRAARDNDAPYISQVFRGRGFGQDVLVAISAPLRDASGAFAGVIEGSLEVNRLEAALTNRGSANEVGIALIDGAGRVVFADARTALSPLESITKTTLAPALHLLAGDLVDLSVFRPDGRAQRLRVLREPCAYGFSAVAIRPVTAGIEQLLAVYLLVGVIVAIALAVATWVARSASGRLAGPLERFAQLASAQAGRGEVAEIDPGLARSPREIELVYDAFNQLVRRIRDTHANLVRMNQELDARVAARTKELRAAQERAEAASRSKTEFVAMTGHEIRTPLNAIIGMADAGAQDGRDGAEERFRIIHQSGVRLLGVVNDLLDLSKVEAGKLELRPRPFELGALVREVAALFGAQAAAQGITLLTELRPPRPLPLHADAPRLQQVLINLVGNALKFTSAGSVRLRIEAEIEGAGPARVQFAVIDTGPGISPEEQSRLFQPYSQLANGAAQARGSSGLGLAISRQLVELFGGQLQVRSIVGQGSEFFFTLSLPLAETAVTPAEPVPALGRGPATLHGLSFLVVDDELANREVLRAFLERAGARVNCVGSAAEAIAALAQERYAAALVDWEMPDGGGARVAAAVGEAGREQCPLIACSAHTADEKRTECLAVGFTEFVPKPVNRADLLRLLERTVCRSPAA